MGEGEQGEQGQPQAKPVTTAEGQKRVDTVVALHQALGGETAEARQIVREAAVRIVAPIQPTAKDSGAVAKIIEHLSSDGDQK
jgi:hypothetical protein